MSAVSSATGLVLFLDHVAELAAVLALLLLCLAVGSAIRDRASLGSPERPCAELVLGLLLGLGAYATAILVLGLAGLIRPWALGLATAAIAAVTRHRFGKTLVLLRRCSGLVRSRWDLAAFAVLGVVATALLIQSAAPISDWDSLIYHLEAPKQWLAAGRIHLPPDNLHAAYTGLVHMLYLPLLAIGAPSGAATLNAILGCVLAVALFEFGDRFFDRTTGRIAMITLFGSPAVIFVAMTARIDVTLTLFLVWSLYSLYATLFDRSNGPEGDREGVYVAALVLGLGTGVKLIALPWLLCLGPIFLWAALRRSRTWRGSATLLARAGFAFLVGAAPWMVLRWHLVDTPFYPLLSPRYIEPWLRPWFGDTRLTEAANLVFETAPLYTSDPVSLKGLLFEPGSLTPEREGVFYYPGLLLWLTPLALLRWRRTRLWVLVAVGVAFVLVVPNLLGRGERTNLRFIIPALAVLTLASANVLAWASRKTGGGQASRALVGALVALALVPAFLPFVFRWSEMPTLSHLSGTVSEDDYLTRNENADVHLWARTARWLDRRLSSDDRVLMLFEGRGFRLDTPKIQDNLMANWPLLAQRREPGDCLARARVTHVLVNYGVLDVHMAHGMPASVVAWPEFSRFARECLSREAVHETYALYSVAGGREDDGGSTNPGDGEEP